MHNYLQPKVVQMRLTVIGALLSLSLLPATTLAQTAPQTAAVESSASAPAASPASSGTGGITRDQYLQRAQERAALRAGARFDQMDTNHNGVVDRAELRAWRTQHPRHAAAPPPQPAPQ
jgi:hypothetical protein